MHLLVLESTKIYIKIHTNMLQVLSKTNNIFHLSCHMWTDR